VREWAVQGSWARLVRRTVMSPDCDGGRWIGDCGGWDGTGWDGEAAGRWGGVSLLGIAGIG